jgi:hypothetical protein
VTQIWRGRPDAVDPSTRGPDRPAAISAAMKLSGLRSRKETGGYCHERCFDYADRARERHQAARPAATARAASLSERLPAIAAGSPHDDRGDDPIGLSGRSSPAAMVASARSWIRSRLSGDNHCGRDNHCRSRRSGRTRSGTPFCWRLWLPTGTRSSWPRPPSRARWLLPAPWPGWRLPLPPDGFDKPHCGSAARREALGGAGLAGAGPGSPASGASDRQCSASVDAGALGQLAAVCEKPLVVRACGCRQAACEHIERQCSSSSD